MKKASIKLKYFSHLSALVVCGLQLKRAWNLERNTWTKLSRRRRDCRTQHVINVSAAFCCHLRTKQRYSRRSRT
jgi:predicted membrane chloride channel (bestrophin family)